MRTQYYTASSLDGYIADQNNSLDWLFQFDSDDEGTYPDFISQVGALAMGSTTYEWVLKNYIYRDPDQPKPWPYEQPAWVFTSRALTALPGADIRFVKGSVLPIHAEMVRVANSKNIWIVGGGDLAGQFYEQALLDEIIVTVAPVFLCSGAPLFTRRIAQPPLRVTAVTPHASGLTEFRLEIIDRELKSQGSSSVSALGSFCSRGWMCYVCSTRVSFLNLESSIMEHNVMGFHFSCLIFGGVPPSSRRVTPR